MRRPTIHNIIQLLKPIATVHKSLKRFSPGVLLDSTPILAYHSISGYRNMNRCRHFTVDPRLFHLQMHYLHEKNYKVMNLKQYHDFRQRQVTIKDRSIVLTFDDGYADSYFNAYPILQKYGFSATFFLTGTFIGSKKIFPWLHEPLFPKKENLPLSVGQILKMAQNGMAFGSHTYSHQRLAKLSQEVAFEEIQDSKAHLENLLHREIHSFSYPFGSWNDFDHSHQEMVRKAGYKLAVTSIYGSNKIDSNLFSLKRIPIYANDDLNNFQMKINGHYDWIEKVQKLLALLQTRKEAIRSKSNE